MVSFHEWLDVGRRYWWAEVFCPRHSSLTYSAVKVSHDVQVFVVRDVIDHVRASQRTSLFSPSEYESLHVVRAKYNNYIGNILRSSEVILLMNVGFPYHLTAVTPVHIAGQPQ